MKKWFGRAALALALLVAALAAFAWLRSEQLLRAAHPVEEAALAIPGDAAAIERGRHIAVLRGCTDCHDADLGGRVVADAPAVLFLAAPNLTRGEGGLGQALQPRDWERAVRHGVRRDGRSALFMPAGDFAGMTDADVADLIAYASQVRPVARRIAPPALRPIGRALVAFGLAPLLSADAAGAAGPHRAQIAKAPSADYGAYLARSCSGCHGEHYSGGRIPGAPASIPAAANLTPDASGLAGWSRADFAHAVREGRRPDGRQLDAFMPWRAFAELDDVELDALWAYLHGLAPRPYGQR